MNKINLKQTINKCIIYYGVLGLVIGLIMLIVTILNPTVPFHVGKTEYYGFMAGILSLLSMPIVFGFIGFTHAILIWYPIIVLIRYLKKK